MTATPPAWDVLVAELAPWMAPDWTRRARENADQGWVRLVLLVDARQRLAGPGVDEKIAVTMAKLAEGREAERSGWTEVLEHARRVREEHLARVADIAPRVLPPDQLALFVADE